MRLNSQNNHDKEAYKNNWSPQRNHYTDVVIGCKENKTYKNHIIEI